MIELRDITKRFGAVLANDHININVPPGTIHAIVGENGAGKSTAMRIAYGFYSADSGQILVDGQVVEIRNPHDAIALGIGMVHQHFMLVETMTVAENIVLGAEPGTDLALDLVGAGTKIRALSEEFKLAIDPNAEVEKLSVGQQQRVELLKALYREARLLILDEPTAVLTPQEVEEFFVILRRMKQQGKTVVIITHKLDEVLAISDDVTVMRDGKVIGNVKTAETNAAELARMMVGRDVLLRLTKDAAKPGAAVLSVKDLTVRGEDRLPRLSGLNLEVRAGEVVGIAGVEGNGQTELIEGLAGLVPSGHLFGRITLNGTDITHFSARRRKELGIAHIPEDRHRRGLLLESPLTENAILGVHYRPPAAGALVIKFLGHWAFVLGFLIASVVFGYLGSRASGQYGKGLYLVGPILYFLLWLLISVGSKFAVFLDDAAINRRTDQIIRDFDVRPPNRELPARSLSGGNQQKLIIGREFELPPKLLLVSQPTRGVDIGAIEFIHRKLVELRDAGVAILLVSAELEEVTSLSDRLLVIHDGKIVGEVDPAVATHEEIGLLMTGGAKDSSRAA